MRSLETRSSADRHWHRGTTLLLLVVGLAMAAIAFGTVMTMPDMMWHSARDAELRATYDAYRETGTLLIKETGSGSYGVQAPASGPMTFATWDDDPGSYVIASLMGHVTGSDSPYPGLKLAQALLVAIPLVWLPLAVARVVGRARAGFALILLPLVIWLLNHGAPLIGTEYGLSDRISTLAVYSLYGTAASLAFLSLSLLVFLSTYRLRLAGLIVATVGVAVLAAAGNMSRSLSGMGIAVAVGVLWWLCAPGRWRWAAAVGGALAAVLLATTIQTGVMTLMNVQRAEATGQAMSDVPDAHTAWHSLYLGLSYPEPLNGQPSRFDVTWSDEYGWAKAREVDPDVLVASEEYDEILQGLYLSEVRADPAGAMKLYIQKAWFLAKHFGGLLLFILIGFAVGLSQRGADRPRLGRVIAIVTPLLILGLVPPIMVMPMLYYYSELAAALGLLSAVSLGVIVWSLTSWPARVRSAERERIAGDPSADGARTGSGSGLSVIVDVATSGAAAAHGLLGSLTARDELLIIGGTIPADVRTEVNASPTGAHVVTFASSKRTGSRLREAVLASTGGRVLIIAGAAPLNVEALVEEVQRDDAPDATAARTSIRPERASGAMVWLRRVILGSAGSAGSAAEGAVLVDGARGRAAAELCRESGDFWIDEFEFALEVRGERALMLPQVGGHLPAASRAGVREVPRALAAYSRIAARREEYARRAPQSESDRRETGDPHGATNDARMS